MAADAGDVRAIFTVSATVPARASIETISEPLVLTVSQEDVARGYVDVSAAYRVGNNDPAGFLLRLAPLTGLASSIEVDGLGSAVMIGQEVVEVTAPAALPSRDLKLRFRFTLDPAVPAGAYPMPVQVSVTAL